MHGAHDLKSARIFQWAFGAILLDRRLARSGVLSNILPYRFRLLKPPRSKATVTFGFCLATIAGALCLCTGADAQTVLDNTALLGQSASELQPRLGLQAVRSPRRLSSGAVDSGRLVDAVCEGLHFEETFFFARQKLQQMELVLTDFSAQATDKAQAMLMQTLRAELGPELASFGAIPIGPADSASWVSGDADVMLFRFGRPDHPSLRLVIRQRELVNAEEL
jgi:hypothetical protein